MAHWLPFLALLVVGLAVLAIARKAEVRLTLILAGLALGCLAGHPALIVQTFFAYFCREQFLLPIGTSLGFAYVLRQTGCDRELVRLLLRPVRHVRFLLPPAAVLVGVVVNVPVVSQMSTAVLVGSVLVPLMRGAGFSPVVTGAALLLGASTGGEFLNPGSPELRSVGLLAEVSSGECVRHAAPLLLVQLAVCIPVFWYLCAREERLTRLEKQSVRAPGLPAPAGEVVKEKASTPAPKSENRLPLDSESLATESGAPLDEDKPIHVLKALVPLLPLVLLFLTALPPPFQVFDVPTAWLVDPRPGASPTDVRSTFEGRLIGTAMVLGAVVAALVEAVSTGRRALNRASIAFFDGVGHALTHIVSLITCAVCFGKGIEACGVAKLLGDGITSVPHLLFPGAATLPMAFACLCGSGMASTQSLFGFFLAPATEQGVIPAQVGAVVSLAAAAGRTMSPVAAVVLASSAMSGAPVLDLIRRVALPLFLGMTAVVAVAWLTR